MEPKNLPADSIGRNRDEGICILGWPGARIEDERVCSGGRGAAACYGRRALPTVAMVP